MLKYLLLLAIASNAYSLDFMSVRQVGLELEKYQFIRDPYFAEDSNSFKYRMALETQIDLLSTRQFNAYFQPLIHFRGTESQVRHGGLYFLSGFGYDFRTDFRTDFFYRHHSQHVMERARKTREFPVQDSYVIKFQWFTGPSRRVNNLR